MIDKPLLLDNPAIGENNVICGDSLEATRITQMEGQHTSTTLQPGIVSETSVCARVVCFQGEGRKDDRHADIVVRVGGCPWW